MICDRRWKDIYRRSIGFIAAGNLQESMAGIQRILI